MLSFSGSHSAQKSEDRHISMASVVISPWESSCLYI